jgi:hypothetical protein
MRHTNKSKARLLFVVSLIGTCLGQNVVVNPTSSQNIVQPVNTQTSTNNLDGIRYVTQSDNWSQSPSGTLTAGTPATVTLTPCPVGIDTTNNAMYYAYISTVGTAEAVSITGGSCTPGAASGTVTFTPANSHGTGYTIGSASSGIQEAINDACGLPNGSGGNPNAHVILPPTASDSNALKVYGTIYAHCSRTLIEGNGTFLNCFTRARCLMMGDLLNSNDYSNVTIKGIRFESALSADGCTVVSTANTAGTKSPPSAATFTITVASGCTTIQTGDWVNVNFTDNPAYWGTWGPVTVSGTTITWTILENISAVPSANTPGTVAVEAAAIEDNTLPGTIEDVELDSGTGFFNQGIVADNDQAMTIRNPNYVGGLRCDAAHCGSFVYAAASSVPGYAPVIWLDKANLSMQCAGNSVTDYVNNTLRISDAVIQGFGMWGVNAGLGNYGGTQIDNMYQEEGTGPCSHPYNPNSPTTFFSAAGVIYNSVNQPLSIRGGTGPQDNMPSFLASSPGTVQLNYYIVEHDTNESNTFPLYAGYCLTTGSGTCNIQWPRIPGFYNGTSVGTVTYDLLRMQYTPGVNVTPVTFPQVGNCTGGSATACGSVATTLSQCTGLLCTYTDTASANTSSYSIAPPQWDPVLPFWPGTIVLHNANNTNPAYMDLMPVLLDRDLPDMISELGLNGPSFFVRRCNGPNSDGSSFAGNSGGAWIQCLEGDNHGGSFAAVGALLLQNGAPSNSGGMQYGVKGRLNFMVPPYDPVVSGQHVITLADSNPDKTLATSMFRPTWDSNDTYIGFDNPVSTLVTGTQLSFGAPVAISSYLGNYGDNASWKTRLSSAGFAIATHLNQSASANFAGTCTFAAATSCRISYSASFTSTPVVILTPVNPGSITFKLTSSSVTGFTISASSSNSLVVNWIAIGNPN